MGSDCETGEEEDYSSQQARQGEVSKADRRCELGGGCQCWAPS